jgi:hypothetical protein
VAWVVFGYWIGSYGSGCHGMSFQHPVPHASNDPSPQASGTTTEAHTSSGWGRNIEARSARGSPALTLRSTALLVNRSSPTNADSVSLSPAAARTSRQPFWKRWRLPLVQTRPPVSCAAAAMSTETPWEDGGDRDRRRHPTDASSTACAEQPTHGVATTPGSPLVHWSTHRDPSRPSPTHAIKDPAPTNNNDTTNNDIKNSSITTTTAAAVLVETLPSTVDDTQDQNITKPTKIQIHTYLDPCSQHVWKALNTAPEKFFAFLKYSGLSLKRNEIRTEQLAVDGPAVNATAQTTIRDEWRQLWKEGRLLTDRTELLAVYPSDQDAATATPTSVAPNRGGFTDLLSLYTERVAAILTDERIDAVRDGGFLVAWLEQHYGVDRIAQLQAGALQTRSHEQQLKLWKAFLEWFRSYFPYFYDRCESCQASMKEDTDRNASSEPDSNADSDEPDHQTFVGYVYPRIDELVGKASRTELYQCHKCGHFTRFPRFNAASHVMDHRRGRCGEYSMLLFRILRALGHDARWVIDWADHVWAEVLLPPETTTHHEAKQTPGTPRWVHMDPCEAAVDHNLLYQEWGKKQTYILGFYAPRDGTPSTPLTQGAKPVADDSTTRLLPMIEDLTHTYTSDSWIDICQRRDESEEQVKTSISIAVMDLHDRLTRSEENDPHLTMQQR